MLHRESFSSHLNICSARLRRFVGRIDDPSFETYSTTAVHERYFVIQARLHLLGENYDCQVFVAAFDVEALICFACQDSH